jgi:mannitol-specific phosphotransferase system IIBC component
MAQTLIPVFEPSPETQVEGLGQWAQILTGAAVSFAVAGASLAVQMKMAKDAKKDAQSLAKKQEARAAALQAQADADAKKAQEALLAQQQVEEARAASAEKLKKGFMVTGGAILGLGAVAVVVGYFVFRKKS